MIRGLKEKRMRAVKGTDEKITVGNEIFPTIKKYRVEKKGSLILITNEINNNQNYNWIDERIGILFQNQSMCLTVF